MHAGRAGEVRCATALAPPVLAPAPPPPGPLAPARVGEGVDLGERGGGRRAGQASPLPEGGWGGRQASSRAGKKQKLASLSSAEREEAATNQKRLQRRKLLQQAAPEVHLKCQRTVLASALVQEASMDPQGQSGT